MAPISEKNQENLPTRVSGPSRRAFLTGSAAAVGAVGGGLAAPAGAAFNGGPLDQGEDWPDGPGTANGPQAPDAELRAILADVDEANVRAIVEKLVSSGTRHTLSSQDDPKRGIGAARDWIFSEPRHLPSGPLPAGRRPDSVPRARLPRPPGSPSPTRTLPTSTRTSGSRTASSSVTCPGSATSPTSLVSRG